MIIASFSTTPDRLIKGLPTRCINTLLSQDKRADLILINIPHVSQKGVVYDKDLAAKLQQPGVIVNWVDTDYGPITKLYGTLEFIEREKLSNVRIILVDDDVQYESWVFQRLIDDGGHAVGYVSRDPILSWGRVTDTKWTHGSSGKTAILETYAGVMYDASIFLPYNEFRDWERSLPMNCRKADDMTIAAWVHKKGYIPERLTANINHVNHDAAGTDELNMINTVGNNTAVLQILFDRFEFAPWQSLLSYLLSALISYWPILALLVAATIWVKLDKSGHKVRRSRSDD